MKNKNRIPLLLKILSKSDELMEDIVQLTMQVAKEQPGIFEQLDYTSLFGANNSSAAKVPVEDYRKKLFEQMKKSTGTEAR